MTDSRLYLLALRPHRFPYVFESASQFAVYPSHLVVDASDSPELLVVGLDVFRSSTVGVGHRVPLLRSLELSTGIPAQAFAPPARFVPGLCRGDVRIEPGETVALTFACRHPRAPWVGACLFASDRPTTHAERPTLAVTSVGSPRTPLSATLAAMMLPADPATVIGVAEILRLVERKGLVDRKTS